MTAPGDGLIFHHAKTFQRADAQVPGLAEAVESHYTNEPTALTAVSAVLRKGGVTLGGKSYEYLLYRAGASDVYLVAVAEVVKTASKMVGFSDEALNHFKGLYKK
jgi:hypothetical protein